MEAEILAELEAIRELVLWCCRIGAIAVGVLVFRIVTLRSVI